MAPSKNAEREAREARDRLRRYTARQTVYRGQVKRRRRDNFSAIIAVIVVAALATITQIVYFTSGPGMPAPTASASPSPSPSAAAEANVGNVPAATIAENRVWSGDLLLNQVDLGIRIDGGLAPQAASVFISLVHSGYYAQNSCQRLTTTVGLKVIQCGQPNGNTSVDPGFSFGPTENTPDDGVYPAGTIAMARGSSLYSQSTQFFITYADSNVDPSNGGYSVIGSVTGGLDRFVSQIAAAGVASNADGSPSMDGAPAIPTTITSVTLK